MTYQAIYVTEILASFVPWVFLPTTPPQMLTVKLLMAPEAAYGKARQAVAVMGHVRATHPEGVAWRELREYAAVLRELAARE